MAGYAPAGPPQSAKLLNQIKGQIGVWLDLTRPAWNSPWTHEAYEFYLRGVSKIVEMEQGRNAAFTEGRSFLERALAIEPSVEVCAGLARLYYRAVNLGLALELKNMDMARYCLDKAVRIRPDYGPLIQLQLRSALQEGRYEDTLKIAARAIAADRLGSTTPPWRPTPCDRPAGIVGAARWRGRPSACFPRITTSSSTTPFACFQQGHHADALKLIRTCVTDEPDKYWGQFYLAHYSLLLGDTAAAARSGGDAADNATTQNLRRQIALIRGGLAERDLKLAGQEVSTTDVNHSCAWPRPMLWPATAALRQFQINVRMGRHLGVF